MGGGGAPQRKAGRGLVFRHAVSLSGSTAQLHVSRKGLKVNQVKAVRVREIPSELAIAGVVVWMGARRVEVPGHREVVVMPGMCGNGSRALVLTIVQNTSKPIWGARLKAACETWARDWLASLRSGSA